MPVTAVQTSGRAVGRFTEVIADIPVTRFRHFR
jgi:hypothetical protein